MVEHLKQIDDNKRVLLIDAKRDAARSFDQTVITLSAGALGISLTFAQQRATKPVKWRTFLSVAWILLPFAPLKHWFKSHHPALS